MGGVGGKIMFAAFMNQAKAVMATEQFRELAKEVGIVIGKEIISTAGEKLKEYMKQRNENMEDGMNSDQSFNHEKSKYDDINKEYSEEFKNQNINWGNIAKDFFKNTFSNMEDIFGLDDNELYSNFKEYKAFLEGDITDEEEIVLINKLYLVIDDIIGDRGLEKSIGEENYKTLLTIIIKHSMSVSREIYKYGKNRINEFQMKENMKTLYENYVLTILDFVKHNQFVKEHGLTVLMLAFGPKVALIQSVVMTIAINVFDGEKRVEMMNTFNKVKSKVKSWYSNLESQKTSKNKESQYENFES